MDSRQKSNRFFQVFKNKHVVLPVIHVSNEEQAIRNTAIANEAGADGIFLINHSISSDDILEIHEKVVEQFPGWWVGINCLGLNPINCTYTTCIRSLGR